MSDPRDAPTPRQSQSWAFFQSAAAVLVARLEKAFSVLTVDQRFEARVFIGELSELEKRFAAWPTVSADQVAAERPELSAKLLDLNRRVEELLRS